MLMKRLLVGAVAVSLVLLVVGCEANKDAEQAAMQQTTEQTHQVSQASHGLGGQSLARFGPSGKSPHSDIAFGYGGGEAGEALASPEAEATPQALTGTETKSTWEWPRLGPDGK